MITKQQTKYIYTIRPLYYRKHEDEWRDLIATYTGDRTRTSVKDLSFDQANDLIKHLGGRPFYDDNWGLFDKDNRQHQYILSLLHQLGWVTYHHQYGMVPDTRHLSNWLKSRRSPVRKPLRKMNTKELTKVISALEQMIKKG